MNSWLPSSESGNSKTLNNVDLSWLPNYNDKSFSEEPDDSNHQHAQNESDDSWLPNYDDTKRKCSTSAPKSNASNRSRKTEKDLHDSCLPSTAIVKNRENNSHDSWLPSTAIVKNRNINSENHSHDSWLPSAPIVKDKNINREGAREVAIVSCNQQIQNTVLNRKPEHSRSQRQVSPSISECSVETDGLGGVSTLLRRWKDAETKNSNRKSKHSSCNNNINHSGIPLKVSDGSGRRASPSTADDSFIDSESCKSSLSISQSCPISSQVGDKINQLSKEELAAVNKSEQFKGENKCFSLVTGKPCFIRGRQAFLDFLNLMEQDKRHELESLTQRKAVSKFPHRGRIQALLRVRIIRIRAENQKEPKNYKHSVSKTMKNIWDRFSSGVKQGATASRKVNNNVEGMKKKNETSPECSVDCSPDRELTVTTTASTAANSQELLSITTSNQSAQVADMGIEKRHHWINECSQTQSDWDDDDVEDEDEEGEEYYKYNYNWISEIARPRSDWDCMRQKRYQEMIHIYSFNQDMQQLLERKSVSSFLTSDRRNLLDQLMVSRAQGVSTTESRKEEGKYEDESNIDQRSWNHHRNHSNAICDAHQMASPSPSSCPNPYLQNNNNHTSIEMELIYDLRGYVEQIHQEVMELRKAVTSCVNMQLNNQHQSNQKKRSEHVSMSTTRNCCVCYIMQVDSFLYRCGHMCTCYDCGLELQCTSGKCPICEDSVMDVVRAYVYVE